MASLFDESTYSKHLSPNTGSSAQALPEIGPALASSASRPSLTNLDCWHFSFQASMCHHLCPLLVIVLEGRAHIDLVPFLTQCKSFIKVCRVTVLRGSSPSVPRLPLQHTHLVPLVSSPSLLITHPTPCASSDVCCLSYFLVLLSAIPSSILSLSNLCSFLKIWLRHSLHLQEVFPELLDNPFPDLSLSTYHNVYPAVLLPC